LYESLLTDWFIDAMGRLQRGASYPAVRDSDIFNHKIALPPLSEQRQIARVLGLVQRASEQQLRLTELTLELKKSLLKKLFTEGLRKEPQIETEIGPMPESWTATPLGECCSVLSGSMSYSDFLKTPANNSSDSVECMGVKVSDMNLPGNENNLVRANAQKKLPFALAEKKLVPSNAVVFPKRGAAIATNKKRLTTTWTVLDPNLIAVHPKSNVDSNFLFYWTQTFDLRMITDPGPTPQLNKKDLTPLLMPVPPDIREQREIARALTTIDMKIELHRRSQASLNALFRTLLHQLMAAEIRVFDLELPELDNAVAA
jgi:type I restriction enzyme S subunit